MNRSDFEALGGVATSFAAFILGIILLSSFVDNSRSGRELRALGDEIRPSKELNNSLYNELSEDPSLEGMDRMILNYMAQWQFRGVQVSVTRGDSLLFSKGYGEAGKGEAMTPTHLLRLASVSKLVTAAGIMVLCENGKLNLDDKVFGEDGILNDSLYLSAIKDKNYYKITIEDLLRHKGGFTNWAGDPMFTTRDIILQNHLDSAPDNQTLAGIILRRRLRYEPGTSQQYSNFGYLLLSMIIEKASGQPYEDFMQEHVLHPAGCYDFHIAGNFEKDRRINESHYFVPDNEPLVPIYTNQGDSVVRCYGGNDIRALSGAGAWIASSAELARLVASIDGDPGVEDILSKKSVEEMTAFHNPETFSLGWNDTDPAKGWDRTGSFSGTSALIHRYPDGECWIFISNTNSWKGSTQARYTRELFRQLKGKYSSLLPKQDLFN